MQNRNLGLAEIKTRLAAAYTGIGLKTFKQNPSAPAEIGELPCLFMIEGTDRIQKYSSRGSTGFPATRHMEVILDIVVSTKKAPIVDIKTLHSNVRKTVFKTVAGVLDTKIAPNTYFVEDRTEGPFNYGLPDINAMRLILTLIYTDDGGF